MVTVLIHKQEERVVLAEANSDFVDILFSFLTLPMGTIVRLLSSHVDTSQPPAIGSFTNLYGSIANLEDAYFASIGCKEMLLNTRSSAEAQCLKLQLNIYGINPIEYFTCRDHNCVDYFTINRFVKCKKCSKFLDREAYLCDTTSGYQQGVFVQPTASFVMTDDLHVIPNSPGLTLALLKNSGVSDFEVLEEKTFQIGRIEILELLKYSILSKTPLTSMLLSKNYMKIDKSVQIINNCKSTDQRCVSFKEMTIKVLVRKSNNTILLASSSQDFIDFLFSLITVPLGRVISLISTDTRVLCVQNILHSVSDMDVGEDIKSQEIKDMLLHPQLHFLYQWSNQYIPLGERVQKICWTSKVSTASGLFANRLARDSSVDCGSRELKLASPLSEAGFLKVSTKYMVTDDLVVTPLSSISCIKHIHGCKIPPGDIEEQVVNIGMEEALNLLRASLLSTSVLTNGLKHLIRTDTCKNSLLKKPKEEK